MWFNSYWNEYQLMPLNSKIEKQLTFYEIRKISSYLVV